MVVVVPPLRSVFHILCNVPALSELSATRTFATLSRVAPRNPYFDYPTSTPKGCPSNLLVIPKCSPSRRYQPYPHPQVLSGNPPVVGKRKRKRAKRRVSRSQPASPGPGGAPVRSLIADYDVEMDEAGPTPEVDLVDVEMADDFSPPDSDYHRECAHFTQNWALLG